MQKVGTFLKKIVFAIVVFFVLFDLINIHYIKQYVQFHLFYKSAVGAVTTSSQKVEPNMLAIPSLDILAPIVYATASNETVFQADLKNGVVHYPGTADPGQNGNCYIFGHSSDYIFSKGHYKTVLALLPNIKTGARIYVSDAQGNEFVYVVMQATIVSPTDVQYLKQDTAKKMLTVQTSYPVGTALNRFLAIATLQ